jgi:hypothetical protein
MGSGDRSSHYNRGWFNGKGFIGSGHGQVDSLVPQSRLLTGGKYLNGQWYVCHNDCSKGYITKNTLAFERG